MTKSIYIPQSEQYVGGDSKNPFAKIFCSSRTLVATLCGGVCGNCKKDRDAFLGNEVQRQLAIERNNPKYWPGADQETLPDIVELEQFIRIKITAKIRQIEKKKIEAVGLIIHTNERMKVLEKLRSLEVLGLTLDASATLQ